MDDLDRAVLDLEARAARSPRWVAEPSRKLHAAQDELGLSVTAYAQRLNRLLDDPAAELADPVTVHRLRRLRAKRMGQRRAG